MHDIVSKLSSNIGNLQSNAGVEFKPNLSRLNQKWAVKQQIIEAFLLWRSKGSLCKTAC